MIPQKRAARAPPGMHDAKKSKTIVSVAGLFAKKTSPEREDGLSEDAIARKTLRARGLDDLETAKAKRHPAFLEVKEAAEAYFRAKAGSVTDQLNAVHDELVARLDGIDTNGKPQNSAGLPSQKQLDDLQADMNLMRPLTEDTVTIAVTSLDGTVTNKDVKLGDSMDKMRKLFDETEAKVLRLTAEMDEVDEAIKITIHEYNQATKAGGDDLRKNLRQLESDASAYYKQTVEDIEKARKEDKAYSIEANRKLQEFMASL